MKALIIGGGIAGLCATLELQKRGVSCTLIDSGNNESTAVAAGMINPIVFRRTTKSWRADEFLPFLVNYYQKLEFETQESFFHPLNIRRIFSSEQERNEWLKKEKSPSYFDFLHPINEGDDTYNDVANPFGTGRVKQCFWIDSNKFMLFSEKLIERTGKIRREKFEFSNYKAELKLYQDENYDYVIFCEGYLIKDNPFFGNLHISATKGQVLTIESTTIPNNESLNRKCFVLPIGENKFKIGSTYEWHAKDAKCTEEGKQQIIENFQVLKNEIPTILEHSAGLRPTTFDRRPFMGEHPTVKGNFVFNGLGTKGYMIAPLLAKELIDYILENKPLHAEVMINRSQKGN